MAFAVVVRSSGAGLCLSLALIGSLARGQDANLCDVPGEAPDLIVGDITSRIRWGSADGVTAFSFGLAPCNVGSCWANWVQGTAEHPVVGQNIFRLEDGRFEQIGQSWVFHEFFALSGSLCSTGCVSTNGDHLGVRCSSSDAPSYLGSQTRLGPKFEVDPSSGVFPFPASNMNETGGVTYKRLQVHDADLDPALNPGAQYFVELQIVAHDDAAAALQNNNVSYRPLLVSTSSGNLDVSLVGTTVREQPAIHAWSAAEPQVVLTDVAVPGDGRLIVGARVTPIPGGWHYEYAVQNLNSYRSAGRFVVPIPAGTVVTNAGFHDVDYHSGEPFSGVDWSASVTEGGVRFETESLDQNPNANALRWGTLYNFRFDCDAPPGTDDVTIGLFRPGTPETVVATTLVPRACAAVESACADGIDDDCDGRTDCTDENCCHAPACSSADSDGDSYALACDCDDSNPQVWSRPGEARDLFVMAAGSAASVHWSLPVDLGGVAVTYDLVRSMGPDDFGNAAACVVLPDPSIPASTDAQNPPAGAPFFYLARAKNACPGEPGILGTTSSGQPRQGRSCP